MAKAKENLPAKRANTAVVNWEQKYKEDAAKGRKREANVGVGQFMSTRGGILQFQGAPVPGNKLQCVVLAACIENAYYTDEFDPDNPTSPVCYAFGDDEDTMAPHDQSEEKQNGDCKSCPMNRFGSAEKGRGKACKNTRRLAVMHADSLKGKMSDAQIAILKVPPTSLGSWATFVRQLDELHGAPSYGVVSEISIVPDPKSQFKIAFGVVRKIDRKLMPVVTERAALAEAELAFPYQPMEAAPKKKGGKSAGRGQAAAPRRKF